MVIFRLHCGMAISAECDGFRVMRGEFKIQKRTFSRFPKGLDHHRLLSRLNTLQELGAARSLLGIPLRSRHCRQDLLDRSTRLSLCLSSTAAGQCLAVESDGHASACQLFEIVWFRSRSERLLHTTNRTCRMPCDLAKTFWRIVLGPLTDVFKASLSGAVQRQVFVPSDGEAKNAPAV
jgi:hypothetical protein